MGDCALTDFEACEGSVAADVREAVQGLVIHSFLLVFSAAECALASGARISSAAPFLPSSFHAPVSPGPTGTPVQSSKSN